MATRRSVQRDSPLTDAELAEAEQRASALRAAWPRETMLRLITELRRARAALEAARGQPAETLDQRARSPDRDYIPPGGRVTMAEWQALASRLKAERGAVPEPRQLSPEELEERRRRWEKLRSELGWDAQPPLTPKEEAELQTLIQEEIEAYRAERRHERDQNARGR